MNKWVPISVMAVLAIGVIAVGFLYMQKGSELKDAESEISSLEGNVSTLQGTVSGLQGNVSTLEGNVSTLEGNVSTLETDLSNSEATVANLETDYTAAQSEIATLESELSQAQGNYDTLEQKVDKARLYAQIINATTEFEIDRAVFEINDPILIAAWDAVQSATTDDAFNAALDTFYFAVFDGLEAALS